MKRRPGLENIGFSYMPTDKRYVANYKDGAWDAAMTSDPNVVINDECAGTPSVPPDFEGLKAYTTEDGTSLSRSPDLNAERMMDSARRLSWMPPFPKERFLEAVDRW